MREKVQDKDVQFEWDDPRRQEIYDHIHSRRDEERWKTIGMSRFGVLIVVYTDKVHDSESDIRIISARKAERYEAKQYYNMTFSMGAIR
jgi:uncharacterized DUF497 family protein